MQQSPWGFKQFPDRFPIFVDEIIPLDNELSIRLRELTEQENALSFAAVFGDTAALAELSLVLAEKDRISEIFGDSLFIASNSKSGVNLTLVEIDELPVVTDPDAIQELIDVQASYRYYFLSGIEDFRFVADDGDNVLKDRAGNFEFVNLLGGNDVYKGSGFNDNVFGFLGNDKLNGKGGDDVLDGGDGNDKLTGGNGLDLLGGFAGNDRLNGNDGDDFLDGGAGKDKLKGGNGDDWLVGGEGIDKVNGGGGNDVFYVVEGKGFDVIQDFTKGEDEIQFEITNLGVSVENNLGDAWIFQGDDLLAKVLGAGDTLEIGSGIIV